MLDLDMAGLTPAQVRDVVNDHCARIGTVKEVRIMPPAAHRKYAIAAVEMSDAIAAEKVRVRIGDSKIGAVVIIRLVGKHEPAAPPEKFRQLDGAEEVAASADRAPVDILLVEDDPADVRMTREALKAAGVAHRLHVVTDGLEAISFLSRSDRFDGAPRPHVVMVDLNLPKINGHEVLLEVKSNDHLRHIPVVVLTSSQAQRDVRLSYQADADWFVTKPTGLDAFAEVMKKVETLIAH